MLNLALLEEIRMGMAESNIKVNGQAFIASYA